MIPLEMKIDVEWQDRVDGATGDPRSCAIVKAIQRLYPAFTHVVVTKFAIKVSDKQDRMRYEWATPASAKDWIVNYDATKDGDPLAFRLRRDEARAKAMTTKQPLSLTRPAADERKARLAAETPEERAAREKRVELKKRNLRKGVSA